MRRSELWFTALTRTHRGLVSELGLTVAEDRVSSVVNFDNLHTLPHNVFRHRVALLSPTRRHQASRMPRANTDC